MSKETWEEACERQLRTCGDPTPWELKATGLRIPGPPKTRLQDWRYAPRVPGDNVTRIHPAPSIINPLLVNPMADLSNSEIGAELARADARIDAIEHTKRSLLRELERRDVSGSIDQDHTDV